MKVNNNIFTCLAAYNGEKYISKQITSIINQNILPDKLIIHDDASHDTTSRIIHQFAEKNSAINLITANFNIGHVRSFEKLLYTIFHNEQSLTNSIIFLSDQDDYWYQEKIQTILEIFNSDTEVKLVHHEMEYVNETLDSINKSPRCLQFGLQNKSLFFFKQFYKPTLFGAGMAIRSDLISKLLPFPNCVYAHDHWISIVASLHGNIYLTPIKLIKYRQHSNNLTPKNKNNIFKIIKFRLLFLQMLSIALYRKYIK